MFLRVVVSGWPADRAERTTGVDVRKGLIRHGLTALTAGVLLASASMASAGVSEGAAAPDCKLSALDGSSPTALSQHKGKVVLVDFWASWCGPCVQSFPFLNDLHAKHKDQGLQIIGVNVDEKADDAQAFLSNHPAGFSVMRDAGMQCVNDFGVEAMPSSYLIDRKGVVHHIHRGFRAGESDEFRALVEKAVTAN